MEEISNLKKIIEDQQKKKDSDIQKLVDERNKQIRMFEKSEKEKQELTNKIQTMLKKEREERTGEMKDFLENF